MDEQQKVLSVFSLNFWDLFLQKCLRNLASLKCQWLVALYIPTIWGMFNCPADSKEPWISAAVGLGFLGGGFLTLALGRIAANTSLTRDDDPAVLNTDK